VQKDGIAKGKKPPGDMLQRETLTEGESSVGLTSSLR
jgi:hypothetical protein